MIKIFIAIVLTLIGIPLFGIKPWLGIIYYVLIIGLWLKWKRENKDLSKRWFKQRRKRRRGW